VGRSTEWAAGRSGRAGEIGCAGLERLLELASRSFAVPIAAVVVVEGDHFRVVASIGCPFAELPLEGSLPGCTLASGEFVVYPDLAEPGSPVEAPVIDGRPVRFYAGIPVRGPDGGLVGTLCVGDFVPRELDEAAIAILRCLADLVADQLLLAREVEEHRRLAAALAESERRFADFAETASDWLWEMDADLRFSWLSDSVRTRFGFDPAWHYGKTRLEIAATEADRAVAQRIQELMLRREPFRDIEYCRRSPAGDHWLRISGKPIFDAAGRFRGYRGTGRDVTELRRVEAARRAAEERYRRLVEQSPDGVVVHREGRLLFANAKAIEILGGSRLEDVLGVSTVDLCDPAVRPVIAERIRRLAEPGTVLEPFEFRIRRLDGRWIDVETRGVAVVEDGRPAAQVVIRDVSERKRLEALLQAAEKRYRTLFELSPDGLFVKDAEHRILYANRAAVAIFGVASVEDLIGRKSLDFLAPEDRGLAHERTHRLLEEGGVVAPTHLRILRADGSERHVEAAAIQFEEEGEPRVLVVQSDVSERERAEKARREAEERYRTLVELSPDALLVLQDGRYVFANRRALEFLGAEDTTAIVGKRPRDLYVEDDVPAIEARAAQLFAEGGTVPPLEVRIRRLDGEIRDVETSGAAIPFDGKPAIQVAIRDISERKRAERARREGEALYRALVELNPDPVILVEDGRFVFASEPAARLFGLADAGELIGRSIFEFLPEELHATVRARHVTALRGGEVLPPLELEIVRPDGARVEIEAKGSLVIRNGRRMLLGVWRDVTERKALEAELRRLAHHDPLTGLPNRLLFFDRLGQALHRARRHGRSGALLLLDLDGFKLINDSHGHDAGDALLVEIARRLQAEVRRIDTVARLAGDEFALVLYPVDGPAAVEKVGRRILRALREPIEYRGRSLQAAASLGATLFPRDGDRPDALLKNADLALYRAKARGPGSLVFLDRSMHLEIEESRRLVAELRAALAGDALELRFEPRLELGCERPVGLQARLLWNHPRLGPLDEEAFAGQAEDPALGLDLARRTVALALEQMTVWRAQGVPFGRLLLRAPPPLLATEGWEKGLLDALAARGLGAESLAFAIGETALLGRHAEAAGAALRRLRGAGATVQLEDLSICRAALIDLSRRPVDAVRLCAGRVRALLAEREGGAGSEGAVVARIVVAVARELGLVVAAEGIDDRATLEAVRALGCSEGQGALWATPLPAEAVPGWLAARAMNGRAERARIAATGRPRGP